MKVSESICHEAGDERQNTHCRCWWDDEGPCCWCKSDPLDVGSPGAKSEAAAKP